MLPKVSNINVLNGTIVAVCSLVAPHNQHLVSTSALRCAPQQRFGKVPARPVGTDPGQLSGQLAGTGRKGGIRHHPLLATFAGEGGEGDGIVFPHEGLGF